jgi:Icc-related predicted phosphoesterase
LPEAAAEYGADLLILAGDLLTGGSEDEQSAQAREVVIPLIRAIRAPVCYIMGNDDHIDLGYEDERIRPVHGRRLDFGACGVAGYQYSTPFIGGCYEKPDDEIAADLRRIEPILDQTTILVTHTPAYGYTDRIFSGDHVGSHALADLLARKNVLCHIHGHIHHSFGRAANHFNVAAGGRRRAMIIDVPSLSHFVIEGG